MARPPDQANAQYGTRSIRVVRLDLGGMPERQDVVGQVEADASEAGDRPKAGVPQDERTGR